VDDIRIDLIVIGGATCATVVEGPRLPEVVTAEGRFFLQVNGGTRYREIDPVPVTGKDGWLPPRKERK
jgi:hypothetical protein